MHRLITVRQYPPERHGPWLVAAVVEYWGEGWVTQPNRLYTRSYQEFRRA